MITTRPTPLRLACATVVAFGLLCTPTQAQNFPDRPITLVVPFSPGGATDVAARLLAAETGQSLGQAVVVENKPGAAGALGAHFVARSAPDGYTVCLCGGGPMVILALLDTKLPYVPTRDLAPVTLGHLVDYVVVVDAASPYRTLADVVKAARAQPEVLSYGSTGGGGPAHLGMTLFQRASGTRYLHVPYKGESQVVTDVIGGRVDIGLLSVQSAEPLITSGKVRGLAVWSSRRSGALPAIPTVAEQGYPGYEAGTFVGFNVANGTPAAIVQKLHDSFAAAYKTPEVRDKLQQLGFTPLGLPPAAYAAFLHREQEKWGKVIAETGLKGRE